MAGNAVNAIAIRTAPIANAVNLFCGFMSCSFHFILVKIDRHNTHRVFDRHTVRFAVDYHFEAFFEAFVFGGRGIQFELRRTSPFHSNPGSGIFAALRPACPG
jgi:hypothetical protein